MAQISKSSQTEVSAHNKVAPAHALDKDLGRLHPCQYTPYTISMHMLDHQVWLRQGCCILVNQHAKTFAVAFVLSRHCCKRQAPKEHPPSPYLTHTLTINNDAVFRLRLFIQFPGSPSKVASDCIWQATSANGAS